MINFGLYYLLLKVIKKYDRNGELYEKLVEYAKSQETGVSSIVRLALKEYLSNH